MIPASQAATRKPPIQRDQDYEARDDLDHADEVHEVLCAAGRDVVDPAGQV